jgi:hypothetical protein
MLRFQPLLWLAALGFAFFSTQEAHAQHHGHASVSHSSPSRAHAPASHFRAAPSHVPAFHAGSHVQNHVGVHVHNPAWHGGSAAWHNHYASTHHLHDGFRHGHFYGFVGGYYPGFVGGYYPDYYNYGSLGSYPYADYYGGHL